MVIRKSPSKKDRENRRNDVIGRLANKRADRERQGTMAIVFYRSIRSNGTYVECQQEFKSIENNSGHRDWPRIPKFQFRLAAEDCVVVMVCSACVQGSGSKSSCAESARRSISDSSDVCIGIAGLDSSKSRMKTSLGNFVWCWSLNLQTCQSSLAIFRTCIHFCAPL